MIKFIAKGVTSRDEAVGKAVKRPESMLRSRYYAAIQIF
jgi:hypothetical protein